MKNRLLIFFTCLLVADFLSAQCNPDTEPPVIQTDTVYVSCTVYDGETTLTQPLVSDNCDDAVETELIDADTDFSAMCGTPGLPVGATFIDLTYTATDASGNTAVGTIVYAVLNAPEAFFPADISWTADQYAAFPNVTDAAPLTDDLSETGSGVPDVEASLCNYAVSSDDEIVNTCGTDFFVLRRTWLVFNWCTNTLQSADSAGNDNVQLITIGEGDLDLPPTAVCNALEVELFPLDENGDGFTDECVAAIYAVDLAAGSSDDNTLFEELSFYFGNDPDSTFVSINSGFIGENEFLVYVADTSGCFSVCEATVNVTAPGEEFCTSVTANFFGQVRTVTGQGIKDVLVDVNGVTTLTDADGNYSFENLTIAGENAVISCFKNNDIDNGLSVLDLLQTRRHILAIEPIAEPVYVLAADANNNGVVSAADLIVVRQAILADITEFPNSNSWRFFYGSIALGTDTAIISVSDGQNIDADFTGYKVGDVNGTAVPE